MHTRLSKMTATNRLTALTLIILSFVLFKRVEAEDIKNKGVIGQIELEMPMMVIGEIKEFFVSDRCKEHTDCNG
jgi:hypothetical protein